MAGWQRKREGKIRSHSGIGTSNFINWFWKWVQNSIYYLLSLIAWLVPEYLEWLQKYSNVKFLTNHFPMFTHRTNSVPSHLPDFVDSGNKFICRNTSCYYFQRNSAVSNKKTRWNTHYRICTVLSSLTTHEKQGNNFIKHYWLKKSKIIFVNFTM